MSVSWQHWSAPRQRSLVQGNCFRIWLQILKALNPIVKLLIKDVHIINTHTGVEQTRCLFMQNYLIFNCRALFRQTVRQWFPCRRLIQEIQQPQMSDLPCEWLPGEHHSVFVTTGNNVIGSFPVSQGCRHATRHVLLFTCLMVREVHLEITENRSTDSTMSWIRRFISRRGKPKNFISDNGKSFVSSCSDPKKSIKEHQKNYLKSPYCWYWNWMEV